MIVAVALRVPMFRLLALSVACLGPHIAFAAGDIDPGIVAAQTGDYLVAPLDGADGCKLTLTADEAIGGYAVAGAESCAKSLPTLADVAAWNFDGNGGLLLIDVLRKVHARFEESEGSPLVTNGENGPRLALVPAVDGVWHLPAPENMKGAWQMKRPDGIVICQVSFLEAADGDGNLALSVGEPCDSVVRKLKLRSWTANGLGITLLGEDGSSLAFTATPSGFEKDRNEGGKPLLLIRN
ncbi:AprI/Inh family metalloprotease inhibitor [Ensifer adhaerens]|uniref:AprI/Inh family metalloprotease inhibitor n=1 Tax=Ensifer adhaerens TaxID=106592 RepID=UPI0023A9BFCC|nr:AprI/Inh family metalloprotease inhibitor [Ensifer adhaerens]WDZ77968.1 AprI/Inh family metalloprotease inhibitor [Ensifer adhaerens]